MESINGVPICTIRSHFNWHSKALSVKNDQLLGGINKSIVNIPRAAILRSAFVPGGFKSVK